MQKHTHFFLPMIPPTVTAQEHKIGINKKSKPFFYDMPELQAAKTKLRDSIAPYRPETPARGAVRLLVKWCFPITGTHHDGEYKITRPDTDNLQKALKDIMTVLHFWKDDAQVASEICEKFYAKTPGLYIEVWKL